MRKLFYFISTLQIQSSWEISVSWMPLSPTHPTTCREIPFWSVQVAPWFFHKRPKIFASHQFQENRSYLYCQTVEIRADWSCSGWCVWDLKLSLLNLDNQCLSLYPSTFHGWRFSRLEHSSILQQSKKTVLTYDTWYGWYLNNLGVKSLSHFHSCVWYKDASIRVDVNQSPSLKHK